MTIEEYAREFFQEVHRDAEAAPQLVEESFFERFSEVLVEAGELPCADPSPYRHPPRGIRVDGYGGDPKDDSGTLSLIVADFLPSDAVATLTGTAMNKAFQRLTRFLERALDARWRNSIEETSPGYRLADLVSARWRGVSRIRMFLITNRLLSERVDGRAAGDFGGRPVSYSVWDLGRLHRLAGSRSGREELVVDFEKDFDGGLPVLPAHLEDVEYESFLAVIPGPTLAAIYEKWGARLLEQNVRVFLQARSKVNKGIRKTIESEAPMFFAYNNGLTATAEKATVKETAEGRRLCRLRNFQIVNGGQTTASIHAAHRRKRDLSRVFVQMKLSIVDAAKAEEMVPRISEYANSQNRVNAADFFANHPFHIRVEEFSRRVFAPAQDGSFRQTKWFYERARGQYASARALLTPAQRRRFGMEYPAKQKFQKTDLAKFLNVWRDRPHTVSLGAQKNFANFAQHVGRAWEKRPADFNEAWYRELVAKAIVFRSTERIVSAQGWYQRQRGYRANIVAYAIARIAHELEGRKESLDLESIWRKQVPGAALQQALASVARVVSDVLHTPGEGIHNITEWAKKPACWSRVRVRPISLPSEFGDECVSREVATKRQRAGRRDQRELDGIQAQIAVVQAGAAFWRSAHEWGQARRLLSPKDAGILRAAGNPRGPTQKQSIAAVNILGRLNEEGYPQTLRLPGAA